MKNLLRKFSSPIGALIAGILSLAILALIAVGINQLNNKNQNTAQSNTRVISESTYQGWQDYRSDKYGFNIKLPADMVVKESQGTTETYANLIFSNSAEDFEIQVQPVESVEVGGYYMGFWGKTIASSTTAAIDGKSAIVLDGLTDSRSQPVTVYAVKNGENYYAFLFGGSQLNDAEKTILDSFKFYPEK